MTPGMVRLERAATLGRADLVARAGFRPVQADDRWTSISGHRPLIVRRVDLTRFDLPILRRAGACAMPSVSVDDMRSLF